MPSPVTAPPSVIVLSCGTTSGMTPRARVAAASVSYVVMPWTWAVRAARSTSITPVSAEVSSRCASRSPKRKRFEVFLPSRTRVSGPSARYWRTRSSTAATCWSWATSGGLITLMTLTLVRAPAFAKPKEE